jgi:hypothetical protein
MDPISLSGLVNLGYLAVGVLALWLLVIVANRTGISGRSFTLHGWLDAIGDAKDPKAMALVVAGFLVAGAILASAFIRG